MFYMLNYMSLKRISILEDFKHKKLCLAFLKKMKFYLRDDN